ncbi:MAG: hypothetical protein U0894_16580 [Pirellulales bacterium]
MAVIRHGDAVPAFVMRTMQSLLYGKKLHCSNPGPYSSSVTGAAAPLTYLPDFSPKTNALSLLPHTNALPSPLPPDGMVHRGLLRLPHANGAHG